jgi:hypothetical protein
MDQFCVYAIAILGSIFIGCGIACSHEGNQQGQISYQVIKLRHYMPASIIPAVGLNLLGGMLAAIGLYIFTTAAILLLP